MALLRHAEAHGQRPLLWLDRTQREHRPWAVFDPTATLEHAMTICEGSAAQLFNPLHSG